MEWTYKTEQGDTWDSLAHDIYGSEKLMSTLMQANPNYIDVVVFDYGVVLVIPPTPTLARNKVKAPWDD